MPMHYPHQRPIAQRPTPGHQHMRPGWAYGTPVGEPIQHGRPPGRPPPELMEDYGAYTQDRPRPVAPAPPPAPMPQSVRPTIQQRPTPGTTRPMAGAISPPMPTKMRTEADGLSHMPKMAAPRMNGLMPGSGAPRLAGTGGNGMMMPRQPMQRMGGAGPRLIDMGRSYYSPARTTRLTHLR